MTYDIASREHEVALVNPRHLDPNAEELCSGCRLDLDDTAYRVTGFGVFCTDCCTEVQRCDRCCLVGCRCGEEL